MGERRAVRGAVIASVVCFVANFGVFLYSYRRLVFPYLTEEQRTLNADLIMTNTVGAFAAAAVLFGVLVYWLLSRRSR